MAYFEVQKAENFMTCLRKLENWHRLIDPDSFHLSWSTPIDTIVFRIKPQHIRSLPIDPNGFILSIFVRDLIKKTRIWGWIWYCSKSVLICSVECAYLFRSLYSDREHVNQFNRTNQHRFGDCVRFVHVFIRLQAKIDNMDQFESLGRLHVVATLCASPSYA